jgi:hypothetical protein
VLNINGIHDVRHVDIHTAEQLVLLPSLVEMEIAIGKLKSYKLKVMKLQMYKMNIHKITLYFLLSYITVFSSSFTHSYSHNKYD